MRLKGGGAAVWQRDLRARFVAEVLRLHHFTVNVTGDLMNGWVRGLDQATGVDKLAMIGHLLRFLARLDMWMSDETHVKSYTAAFVEAEAAALAPGGANRRVPQAKGDKKLRPPLSNRTTGGHSEVRVSSHLTWDRSGSIGCPQLKASKSRMAGAATPGQRIPS